MCMKKSTVTEIGSPPTNGGQHTIDFAKPFSSKITIEGSSDILFHRWNCDAIDLKAKAAKGSAAKKTDDTESFLYRTERNTIGIPGEYLRQSILHAAKYQQDPRSPRKSLRDLAEAAIQSLTFLSDTGIEQPDYLDRRRVTVQQAGITRTRPALRAGWNATFVFRVLLPQYIDPHGLVRLVTSAGELIGIADFRPTFGRYLIKSWEIC